MIKSASDINDRGIEIDLGGPQGNAFNLIGAAHSLCRKLGKDFDDVHERMTSGEYENLVKVFDDEFGAFVTLYRQKEKNDENTIDSIWVVFFDLPLR